MAKKRRRSSPAKTGANVDALEALPPPEVFEQRVILRGRISAVLLNLLSVVLLGVSFAPFGCWYLAYVAMVPWMLALTPTSRRIWPILWSWLAGFVFWAACLYWLSWITVVGYLAGTFYLSWYWLVAALIVRSALRRNMPMWLIFPVVWVALEYARAYLIAFPWFYLAHTQYEQTQLIQIVDITGQYGLSFFVAMINGAVVDLLILPLFVKKPRGARLAARIATGALVSCATVAVLLGYGWWRLGQNTTSPGPVIGIVQHAFPIALSKPRATDEKILADHLRTSRRFIGSECDVVMWPETMLTAGLNHEFIELLMGLDREGGRQLQQQAAKIGTLSRQLGCPILAGGTALLLDAQTGKWLRYNSALWFDGTWRDSARYDKRYLVPFSEYVPFRKSWPAFHRLLRGFVPPQMPQMAPGKEARPFVLKRDGRTYKIATTICFEGTFARLCRSMVVRDGRKVPNLILANLSNDGWFILQWRDRQYRSTEHAQHLVHYYFRAVENRVPVVRAVNTGISAYIDSNGRLRAVLEHSGMRSNVVGALLLAGDQGRRKAELIGGGGQVLVDGRLTVYSQVGDVFVGAVSLAAVALTVWLILHRRKRDEEIAK